MTLIGINIFVLSFTGRSNIAHRALAFHARWIGFPWRRANHRHVVQKKALLKKTNLSKKTLFFMSLSLADAIRNAKRKRPVEELTSDMHHDIFGASDDEVSVAELHRVIEQQEDSPKAQRSEEEAFAIFSAEKIDAVRMETRDEEHTQRVLKTLWSHIKLQPISRRYFGTSVETHIEKGSTSDKSSEAVKHGKGEICGDARDDEREVQINKLEHWNTHLLDMILMETQCSDQPRTTAEKIALIRKYIIYA